MVPTNHQKISLGLGIVAENSLFGKERTILVVPITQTPNMKGKLEYVPYKITTNGVNAKGMAYTDTITSSSALTAVWYTDGGNRITAPQMRKGERVELFRFEGDSVIYFTQCNFDRNLKLQEAQTDSWAAKKQSDYKDIVESTAFNTYSRTIDGTNGFMEYRLSEANGEISPWLFRMDAKKGVMYITDLKKNIIEIDTAKTIITIENADGSKVVLDKQVINIYAPDTINIEAGKTINIKAPDINVECTNLNIRASDTQVKSDTFSQTSNTVNYNVSGSYTVDCPTITLKGQVSVGGLDTGAGGGSSNAAVSGSLSVDGPVKLNGGTSNGRINGS